jgi:hypothetical protein
LIGYNEFVDVLNDFPYEREIFAHMRDKKNLY